MPSELSQVVLKWPGIYNWLNLQVRAVLDKAGKCGGEGSPATEADPEGAVGESHSSGDAFCRGVTGLFLEDVGNTSTCLSVNGLNSSKKKKKKNRLSDG